MRQPKHGEPYEDLNPSVQVMFRPLGQLQGKSAVELMKMFVPTIQRTMADFEFVEKIQETIAADREAASAKLKYTVGDAAGWQPT